MEAAGVVPEQDLGNQEPRSSLAPAPPPPPVEPGSEERLSVFEDFLSNLNLGEDLSKTDDEDDSDEEKPDKDKDKDK